MSRFGFVFALGTAMLSIAVCAQAPDPFRGESAVVERTETRYRMHRDGTGDRVVHALVRVQSDGAARELGVLVFSYASAYETPHIKYVRVRKADGTTVETPPDSAIEMAAGVTREAPLYSDLKEKHLAVRSLAAGDKLEYEVDTTIDKAQASDQFWGAFHFVAPGSGIALAQVLTLEVPRDKYVQVWSPNHKPATTETDSTRIYQWEASQLVPAPKPSPDGSPSPKPPKDPDEDAEGHKLPSVAWTTFKNWDEVGEWYRSMATPRANPTTALRKRADDITKDLLSPEDQVRAIYKFVSSTVRYVGIDFGVGRYQPHTAEEVLDNQYGDCKDKDTLLEALLRAKNFKTAPALVGVGEASPRDVPSPAMFNHVITTVELPSGRIWLDATPEVAPFRYLIAPIRKHQALLIPEGASATLVETPEDLPYAFSERFEATGKLTEKGELTASISAVYRDDLEIFVRGLARSVAQSQWDNAAQFISSNTGFGGTTSNSKFRNLENVDSPITVSYDYSRHPFGDWDNRRIVPLFPALEFPQLSTDHPEPEDDIDLGALRQMTALSKIQLPENYHTDLPDPIHVKTDFATFDKTYRFDGKEITAERTITILKPKVSKTNWKSYQKFANDISLDGEAWIQLLPPSKPVITPSAEVSKATKTTASPDGKSVTIPLSAENKKPEAPAKDQPASATAADNAPETPAALLQRAREQLVAGDLTAAKASLNAVKEKNPKEYTVWGLLGWIAGTQGDYEEAKTDLRKELDNYPDQPPTVLTLADIERRSGDVSGAEHTMTKFLKDHPDNLLVAGALATSQLGQRDYNSALKTLQAASEQHPDDHNLKIQMAEALVHLERKDEAAAALKAAVDGVDDPFTLNNAAYLLSETGLDLDLAETLSRKSVAALEEKSATISAAEANSKAFAEAETLIASWDTLAWILFEEGKSAEAEPFARASWRDSLRAEVGDHLGQIYEALSKKEEACAVYRLADAAADSKTPPEIRKHVKDSFSRLEAAGAKPGPKNGTDALQKSRTYKIDHASSATGWGTFRIELTADAVIEAQQMSGETAVGGIGEALRKMKFPDLLPPGSKAHLLRSGVVSCSKISGCELVLVPGGGLQTERQ